jgi:hypothetical protein
MEIKSKEHTALKRLLIISVNDDREFGTSFEAFGLNWRVLFRANWGDGDYVNAALDLQVL